MRTTKHTCSAGEKGAVGCHERCMPVIVWLVEVPVGDHVLALVHEGIAPTDPHVPQDLVLCALSPPQPHLNVQYKSNNCDSCSTCRACKIGCKPTGKSHMYKRDVRKDP